MVDLYDCLERCVRGRYVGAYQWGLGEFVAGAEELGACSL